MSSLSFFRCTILVSLLFIGRAEAQTGFLSLTGPYSSNFDVTPGSSFDVVLALGAIGGDPAHSFSFTIPDQPYLSFSNWTPSPPPAWPSGWIGSFTDTSGSGINVTGTDLTDSLNVLGTFQAMVALDAPIGTVIPILAPTNVSLLNASGQQTLTIEPVSYLYVGTVVAAPEPSTWALMFCAMILWGLLFYPNKKLIEKSVNCRF